MPLDLSALEETCSLLLPAYEVTRDAGSAAAPLDPSLLLGPAKGPEETYGLLRRDEWHVQPRGTANFLFGASAAFNDAFGPASKRHFTIRLREASDPMPEGRINTCLMVQGLRTCARRRQDRTDLVRGYAAWTGPPKTHRWISQLSRSRQGAEGITSKTVLFGRLGRGALFAPTDDGMARILLIDFHVADRDDASPDLMLVWASSAEVRVGDLPHYDPRGVCLSDDWRALILEAMEGHRSEHGP